MDLLSLDDCRGIVEKRLGKREVNIIHYHISSSTEAASGFIGDSKILYTKVEIDGQVKELNFFTKTLPVNDYHKNNVEISGVFYKESEFFKTIWPNIAKYTMYKVAPVCYHSDSHKLLVLENLADQGYKTCDVTLLFDVDHCKAVLSRLASFHAGSFLYEKETNSRIDQMYPHLGCDVIGWFKDENGHPGYEHCQTGVRALGAILDRHFPHISEDVKSKVKSLLASNPSLLLPSKKHRNCLSHSDLWCNNIMFKYNANNEIEDCVLIDYQLFGYNPPSFDVYAMIFIVSDKAFRAKYSTELANFYYKCFCECLIHHGEKPEHFLTRKDFDESIMDGIPVALTNAAIFLHYVLLPEDELHLVFGNLSETRKFMETDRSSIVLRSLEKSEIYRKRVFAALNDCIDYFTGNLII